MTVANRIISSTKGIVKKKPLELSFTFIKDKGEWKVISVEAWDILLNGGK